MCDTFVIDTNVLVNDPQSIFKFGDNEIVIPFVVLEELDGLKKRNDSQGRSSRAASRLLDDLRVEGNLYKGVKLPQEGTLRVIRTERDNGGFKGINDQRILALCEELPDCRLVTEDINLRVMADALGIKAERYQNTMVSTESLYEAARTIEVGFDDIDTLFEKKYLSGYKGYINEYVTLHGEGSALGRFIDEDTIKVVNGRTHAQGITGRNAAQRFAMDALLNEDIELVVLAGPAGTGKSLLAVAAGMEQVIETGAIYKKLTVARPIVPMGKDIGYLPGTMAEKLDPWMGPIYDAIELIIPTRDPKYTTADHLKDLGQLNIEALSYIRGRSLPNQFILIDEAQNLSQHEIKTIITRAGVGTKLVFTGDPYQIDSPYLDEYNNGVSYIIDKFKGEKTFAHITLTKGERSGLAELAARIL